jgi:hypothetical protein
VAGRGKSAQYGVYTITVCVWCRSGVRRLGDLAPPSCALGQLRMGLAHSANGRGKARGVRDWCRVERCLSAVPVALHAAAARFLTVAASSAGIASPPSSSSR